MTEDQLLRENIGLCEDMINRKESNTQREKKRGRGEGRGPDGFVLLFSQKLNKYDKDDC